MNWRSRLAATAPVMICAIYVVYEGIKVEWEQGCAHLIRPLGHAGIFLAFALAGVCSFQLGLVVVANMSLTIGYLSYAAPLVCAGLFLMKQNYIFESVAMIVGLLNAEVPSLSFDEMFAHAGHITLLSAAAAVSHSNAFLLASFVAAIHAWNHATDAIWSMTLLLSAVLSFVLTCQQAQIRHANLWSDRTLFQCRGGAITTCALVVYCVALFVQEFYVLCFAASFQGAVLHALHVGGIFGVVMYIFPQTYHQHFDVVRTVLCLAALIDVVICATRIDEILCNVRIVSALALVVGLLRVEPLTSDFVSENIEIDTKTDKVVFLRCCVVVVYIFESCLQQVNHDDPVESFAYGVHLSFIVGGLSFESVRFKDSLTTRLVRTLLVSEAAAIITWEALSQNFVFSWHVVLHIAKPICMILALPIRCIPYECVLSFKFEKKIDFEN